MVTSRVLAVRGHAEGATARFVLKFTTEGDVQRKVEVRGRLFLTPSPEGWPDTAASRRAGARPGVMPLRSTLHLISHRRFPYR